MVVQQQHTPKQPICQSDKLAMTCQTAAAAFHASCQAHSCVPASCIAPPWQLLKGLSCLKPRASTHAGQTCHAGNMGYSLIKLGCRLHRSFKVTTAIQGLILVLHVHHHTALVCLAGSCECSWAASSLHLYAVFCYGSAFGICRAHFAGGW